VLLASLPIVFRFSLVQPMDFLLVCILIYYLGIVFSRAYYEKILWGLLCGLMGALAYFTKAYAFPFFVVHFFALNAFWYFSSGTNTVKKKVLKNAVSGFALFFLISGLWIITISAKYEYLTFSTMQKTNFNAPGPEVKGGGLEFGVPVFTEGLYEPPNKTAFVVWEDPSYLRGKPWSAWQSKAHFIHFIKLIIKNMAEGLEIFEGFSSFALVIIVISILMILGPMSGGWWSKKELVHPLFTLILFSGGYVLFHFEARYVWLSNVLLLLMGGQIISNLLEKTFFISSARKNVLLLFFTLSFVFVPARFAMQASNYTTDQEMYDLSMELRHYNIKGNFASNRDTEGHDPWHKTFRVAYWLNSRYYGQRGENTTDEELRNELKKYNIDYYFVWGESNEVPEFLGGQKDELNGNVSNLRIYLIRDL
jgi:hypothetical protein